MHQELFTPLGFYTPSFFRIHLSNWSKKPLTGENLHENRIFFHEYIHFLQDVTTNYGLVNLCKTIDYILYCIREVKQNENVNYPIFPQKNATDNVYNNFELWKMYMGSNRKVSKSKIKKVCPENKPFILNQDNKIDVKIVNISFESGEELQFNAIHILEGMAYIMECLCYDKIAPLNDETPFAPYFIAESVANFIHPEFAKDKLNIVALCDYSLIWDNPAPFFVKALKEMKSRNFIPNNPENVYEFCQDSKPRRIIDGEKCEVSVDEVLNESTEKAKDLLSGIFINHEGVTNSLNWAHSIIDQGLQLRQQSPLFMLSLVNNHQNQLENILNQIGTPIITNNTGIGIFVNTHNINGANPQLFWALNQIYKLFSKGQSCCDMKVFCKEQVNITVDDNCNSSPWKRANTTHYCPYGLMWKRWNLST